MKNRYMTMHSFILRGDKPLHVTWRQGGKEWKQVMETRMSECNKSETRYDEWAYMPVYTEVDLKRVKRIGRGWSEW